MRLIKNSVSLALTKARSVARGSSSTVYCLLSTVYFSPSAVYLLTDLRSQSALDPAGPQAGRIISLWWLMFYVTGTVFLIVMAFLVGALVRSRRPRRGETLDVPDVKPEPARERRMSHVVLTGIALTVVILFVFLVNSFLTGRALDSVSAKDHLTIKITGHQWWWEVEYENSTAQYVVTTANEIHVPTGQPVLFKLTATDVIHSFWVPNLHGKTDLIPGHETVTWLRADSDGVYRGQCAEFCGFQHAHMAFTVVAEPPDKFKQWYDSQLAPAVEPANQSQAQGRQVFLSSPCVMCHTVRGTDAGSRVGPDLTHVASRQTIAAGTLENTRGHLAGWVVDSQKIKPGNRMPPNNLEPGDLQALLDYLQSLK
ncbi:MAG TPA: cytochrome c oxidase subunit II [Pyrinomonadaceae bacterium]|nr:cytochrome c oxidase subunit II [Pyrinomonadaceae bacterium]